MTEATLSPTPEQTVTVPEKPEVSSLRLILTLALAGLAAGLLLVLVYRATLPAIERNKEAAIQKAITDVLRAPARTEALYILDGKLVAEADLPAGTNAKGLERVFRGFDQESRSIGFALVHGEPGFQGVVRLIFGYDPATRTVLGMKVLESKETPGLGDKIEKDAAFVSQFGGVATPIHGVKAGAGSGAASDIDMITGATISSKAVIRIINNKLEELSGLLEAHAEAGS